MEICDYSTMPPGFRFHPTEEELVGYYLKRKMEALKIDLDVITDIDLYKMEPWDIEERCKLGYEEQTEWYFFSHKDRKYPTGTRTNRATAAGFWKATGRDKAVLSSNKLIGMRKTLVFYKGRAPNGYKTDWIMHEYRLQSSHHAPTKEEGWVVCRAFRKPIPNQRPAMELAANWNHLHACYNVKCDDYCNNWPPPPPHHHHFHASASSASSDQVQLIMAPGAASGTSTTTASTHNNSSSLMEHPPLLMELPQLHSPTTTATHDLLTNPAGHVEDCDHRHQQNNNNNSSRSSSIIDWRNLDSLLSANATSYDDPFLGCFTSNS